jgi:ribosomal protein L37AE/L43A
VEVSVRRQTLRYGANSEWRVFIYSAEVEQLENCTQCKSKITNRTITYTGKCMK